VPQEGAQVDPVAAGAEDVADYLGLGVGVGFGVGGGVWGLGLGFGFGG